jgi:hypothetical protein
MEGQYQALPRIAQEDNSHRKELDDRWNELAENRLGLPERVGPNEKLNQSKRGHRTKINDHDSNLRKLEKRYDDECEEDDDDKDEGNGGSCDIGCAAVGAAVTIGAGYIAYRCLRLFPSLFPPLWPTLPANLLAP